MRAVHEIETPRPADPMPQTMEVLTAKNTSRATGTDNLGPDVSDSKKTPKVAYGFTPLLPTEFTPAELALGPKKLYESLKRRLHWAKDDVEDLKRECEVIEEIRRREWREKEILLSRVLASERSWKKRRDIILAKKAAEAPLKEEKESKLKIEDMSVEYVGSPRTEVPPAPSAGLTAQPTEGAARYDTDGANSSRASSTSDLVLASDFGNPHHSHAADSDVEPINDLRRDSLDGLLGSDMRAFRAKYIASPDRSQSKAIVGHSDERPVGPPSDLDSADETDGGDSILPTKVVKLEHTPSRLYTQDARDYDQSQAP
jgi:hypothetical protein